MKHQIIGKEAWLEQRMALLRREKVVTHELDLLAKERQRFPWVEIEKSYTLEVADGPVLLTELFAAHSQLIVYHFMYGVNWSAPCDGCSAWADAFNGTIDQIHAHDANLIAVSEAPIGMISHVREMKGWTFDWASSYNSSFNTDFHMSAPLDCESKMVGEELVAYDRGQSGGVNVFAQSEGRIYHTYSAHNRGIQQLNGAYGYVDLLPFGGN